MEIQVHASWFVPRGHNAYGMSWLAGQENSYGEITQ